MIPTEEIGFAEFNLSTETSSVTGSLISQSTTRIRSLADNWFRCEFTFTPTASQLSNRITIQFTEPGNPSNTVFTDNSSNCLVYGYQIEENSFVSSYYRTNLVSLDVSITPSVEVIGDSVEIFVSNNAAKPTGSVGMTSIGIFAPGVYAFLPNSRWIYFSPNSGSTEILTFDLVKNNLNILSTVLERFKNDNFDSSKIRDEDSVTLNTLNLTYDIGLVGNIDTQTVNDLEVMNNVLTIPFKDNEGAILSVFLSNFPQENIDNLNLSIENDGTIGGRFPFLTSSFDDNLANPFDFSLNSYLSSFNESFRSELQNVQFNVVVDISNQIILGPNSFDFNLTDFFDDVTVRSKIPTFFSVNDRLEWNNHLTSLINRDELYRPEDTNFGIQANPEVYVINNIAISELENFSVIQPNVKPFEILIGDLQFAESENYDVIYYDIIDKNSTSDGYTYEGNIIYPNSISILRERLVNSIGTDQSEQIFDWLPGYKPIIIAAYVQKGLGQVKKNTFDSQENFKTFIGKVITVNRLYFIENWTLEENIHQILFTNFED